MRNSLPVLRTTQIPSVPHVEDHDSAPRHVAESPACALDDIGPVGIDHVEEPHANTSNPAEEMMSPRTETSLIK